MKAIADWAPNCPTRAPSADECEACASVEMLSNCGVLRTWTACWYPQIGGYASRCWIEPQGGCFTAWVWHDGEFPTAETEEPDGIHYCNTEQLARFAELAAAAIAATQSVKPALA